MCIAGFSIKQVLNIKKNIDCRGVASKMAHILEVKCMVKINIFFFAKRSLYEILRCYALKCFLNS